MTESDLSLLFFEMNWIKNKFIFLNRIVSKLIRLIYIFCIDLIMHTFICDNLILSYTIATNEI